MLEMDYLDPNKERKHKIQLLVGYVLVGILILITVRLLIDKSSGYNIDSRGQVYQTGFVFFSSQPNPADIYANGKKSKYQTNSRLELRSNIYNITLKRDGYFDWSRQIEIMGADVQHFDYPFLFPRDLSTKNLAHYANKVGLVTQSPDRRWVIVQSGANLSEMSLFDLKNPNKAPLSFTLPSGILTSAQTGESWRFLEWADDNDHLLLEHDFDAKREIILVDRGAPEKSVNLTQTLANGQAVISLADRKYDQYYLYDSVSLALYRASLKQPQPVSVLERVLKFKTYGRDTILYVTDKNAPTNKVLTKLLVDKKSYLLRVLPAGTSYVCDLTKYGGAMYVVFGAASENRVRIYKDPVGQLQDPALKLPASTQVLRVERVNHVSFSSTAQFVMAQNGNRFGVYDIENKKGYNYSTNDIIDPPQLYASWMDGHRLYYISKGRLTVFDYDNLNHRQLMSANPAFLPAFAPDSKYVYSLVTSASLSDFTQTSLLAPQDR